MTYSVSSSYATYPVQQSYQHCLPRMAWRFYRCIILAMLTLLSLLGCGETTVDSQEQQTQGNIKSNLLLTSYTVSMDADYPPYSFRDEKGNAIGFDVDILRSIGEVEGFLVKFDPMSWSTVMPIVGTNRSQIGIGGIAKSDIEEQNLIDKMLLSDPYNYGKDAIATRANFKTIDINAINSFDTLTSIRVATIDSSGYLADIEQLDKKGHGLVIKEQSTFLAYKDLFNNRADIVLADKGVLEYLSQKNPQLPIMIGGKGKYFDEPYGMVFVIDKNHPELQAKINRGISTIVANGTFNKIYTKWFGSPAVYIPGQFYESNSNNNQSLTPINPKK